MALHLNNNNNYIVIIVNMYGNLLYPRTCSEDFTHSDSVNLLTQMRKLRLREALSRVLHQLLPHTWLFDLLTAIQTLDGYRGEHSGTSLSRSGLPLDSYPSLQSLDWCLPPQTAWNSMSFPLCPQDSTQVTKACSIFVEWIDKRVFFLQIWLKFCWLMILC